jgi:hypothetical protein
MGSGSQTRLAFAALAAALGLAFLWWCSSAPHERELDSLPAAAIESVERAEVPAPRLNSSVESATTPESAADSAVERIAVAGRPAELKVTVVDSDLAPIVGATVSILSEEGSELFSQRIGFEGACEIRVSSLLGGAFVHARAKNYFDAVEPLDPFATELQIVLEDAVLVTPSTISGYVQYGDGATVGAGCQVLLRRRTWRTQPTSDDMLRVLAGERVDGLQLTWTDAEGKFSFQVHAKVSHFQLDAGAGGWATPTPKIVLDGGFVGLRMRRLYGAKLRLFDGSAPAVMPNTPQREYAKLTLSDPRPRESTLSDGLLVLGGARPNDLVREPNVLHYVLTSEVELPVLGPQSVELRLPGYTPATVEFDATPVESGFAEVVVPLARTTGGFARLSVVASGASGPLYAELAKPRASVGTLILRGEAGADLQFPCELSLPAPTQIEGVPYGTYRAHYVGAGASWLHALEPLVVDAPTASLVFSLEGYGVVRVTLRDRSGALVRGSFDAELRGRRAARANSPPQTSRLILSIVSSPHAIAPLAAGDYTLEHPHFVFGDTLGRVPFTVRPDTATELEIQLDF